MDLDRGGPELTPELAEVAAAWPLGASLATVAAIQVVRDGRRRAALNEAVHEVRRPLQALALIPPAAVGREPAAIRGSVELAAIALERLEREINGVAVAPPREVIAARSLVETAVERWRGRVARAGGSLSLSWRAGGATVEVDRGALAQALDNLIFNAIEHGGSEIVVAVGAERGSLRIAVVDSGRGARPGSRRRSRAELTARLSGRRRHGHGLRVVRRTAAAQGGGFRMRARPGRTEAILELPLAGREEVGA